MLSPLIDYVQSLFEFPIYVADLQRWSHDRAAFFPARHRCSSLDKEIKGAEQQVSITRGDFRRVVHVSKARSYGTERGGAMC